MASLFWIIKDGINALASGVCGLDFITFSLESLMLSQIVSLHSCSGDNLPEKTV